MTIYVENLDDQGERISLEISAGDLAKLPRGANVRAKVTDTKTGKRYLLRRVSCGLPRCMCALAIVKELEGAQ